MQIKILQQNLLNAVTKDLFTGSHLPDRRLHFEPTILFREMASGLAPVLGSEGIRGANLQEEISLSNTKTSHASRPFAGK